MARSTLALMGLKIGRRAALSAVIVMGAMTVMVVTLVWVVTANLATIRAAGDQFQHSAAVEIAAGRLLTAAVDQQNGLRGFDESGDPAFLAPYVSGERQYRSALSTLLRLTRDNPDQTARIRAVGEAMGRWQAVYAQPQLNGAPGGLQGAELAQVGKTAMDAVRDGMAEVLREEARLARERSAARDRAYARTYAAVYGAGGLVLILGLGLGIWALAQVWRGEREARDHAEAKTRLLAVVSHEIRTPLNGLLGMLQALGSEPLTPAQSDRVAMALDAGQTLTTLLNDLLDASKIEAGRLELVEAEFDLEPMLRGVHGVFEPLARAKAVDLRLEIDPAAEGAWIGDRVRLGQICANLVSNAVKFTETGQVGIHVGVSGSAGEASGLRLSVTDSGIGMDGETIERLFTPFTQADAQTAHRFGGTGLGLSISRALARLMGGDISVSSVAGEGSTFTLDLPLARGQGMSKPTGTAFDPTGLRVLAADDNPTNLRVLAAVLPSLGLEVTLVEGGAEAVSAWAADRFDLVLLDLHMPGCDGFETARRIRTLERPGRPRTPLILLSGDVSLEVEDAGRRAGFDGFVAKPLEIGALVAAIGQAMATVPAKQAA